MTRSPLFEQPRSQPAPIIPSRQESSLIDWLESNGRLIARNTHETTESVRDEEEPEILGLIDTEDIADDFEDLSDGENLDLED